MKLASTYDPAQYESDIYALWEKSGAFRPRSTGKAFSIVLPPPNANGNLHIGHGLTIAIEDTLVRHHRLKGERVLFVPGADHAGFETWVVYEKELLKRGESRFSHSRESLFQQVWDFVALNRENFEMQLRQLGASVDWQTYRFTLDQPIIDRAYATFKQMWDEKLIYRGERIVNFCTFHGTGFADIEVVHKDEPGKLWYLRYPLVDGSGEVIVATTRPETLLGDTAVAVHPDDERYTSLIGKTVRLPISGREVPVIADNFVDRTFGTGAVKLTPAHDPNDFEAGMRHSLPMIKVINSEGNISSDMPARYRGLSVLEARKVILSELDEQGTILKIEDHPHSVGHCYKCDTIIQPLLREQWFVAMSPLAKPAIETLKDNKVRFHPKSKQLQLIRYLENLKDWNISRQIPWGIPIPAFQNVDDHDDWIYDDRIDQEIITFGDKTYHRDPDVFDTWFSSSSWPYATLDFPEANNFKSFYPLSVMDTGTDILYPWVSRMVMFGLFVTGKIPFESVYLHGLIQDKDGQKMSKSKGNVVNPVDKVTLFGSDAFRMGILSDEAAGSNRPYDESKLIGARNFCNKLWNVARYVEATVGQDSRTSKPQAESSADHWIVRQLAFTSNKIDSALSKFHFGEAYEALYHFVWDECADWYIEASKASPNDNLLRYLLESILLLAHPFAPFVTETIWQTLAWENNSILASRVYNHRLSFDKTTATQFEDLQKIIIEIRQISKALKQPNLTLSFEDEPFIAQSAEIIKQLTKIKKVQETNYSSGLYLTNTPYRCWLDIDFETANAYIVQLDEQFSHQTKLISQLQGRLDNKAYITNAPQSVVNQTKYQLDEARQLIESISREQKRFSATAQYQSRGRSGSDFEGFSKLKD